VGKNLVGVVEFLGLSFFLISQNIYIERRRGAQPKVHRKYTMESLRGRGEMKKKILKTNYSRG
jgi:hypothetical protein